MIEVSIHVRQRDHDHEGERHKNMRIPAEFFDEVAINLKFDSVAGTFKLGMEFDPTNEDHAELMCVTHMHECEIDFIYDSGARQRLITGFMLSQGFANSVKPELAQVGGYSKAGLLGDCDIPLTCDLESNGLTFRQVVQKVLNSLNAVRKATTSNPLRFKVKSTRADQVLVDIDKKSENKDISGVMALIAEIEGKADASIEKTTAKESKNALSYLKEIAIQKRLILSHDEKGDLIVGVPYTGDKVLFEINNTEFGTIGVKDMRMVYDGQRMHSHITVVRQADKDGGNAAEYTILNPLVPIVYRPKVSSLSFGDDVTIEQAARNELGNDLRGIVLKITLDRWVVDGRLVMPNNTIFVTDPKLYLYKKSKWFVESVDLEQNVNGRSAVLTCVLPYVYNNEAPINPFVEPGRNTPIS